MTLSKSAKQYKSLTSHLEKKATLESVGALLDWDLKTYIPSKAPASRAKQQALISEMLHKMETSKSYRQKLDTLIDIDSGALKDETLPSEIQASLKVLRREFIQQSKLPASFVKQLSEWTSKSYAVWAQAKKANDFKMFLPYLTKIIELCRKKAEYLGYQDHPYDALLDTFEPEMTSKAITPLFFELQKGLTNLIKKVPQVDRSVIEKDFPKETQLQLGHEILDLIGLSSDYCRLDESVHPFCTSLHPTDVRLTTRVYKDDLMACLGSVLHEAGHGLYQHQLPSEHFGTPLGNYCSLAIHESQSRFYEVFLGKSKPFWSYFYPKVQQAFKSQLAGVSLDQFYRAIHRVKPTFIRVESDEVTYNLHVIVRFECEMAMIEGSLQAKDIPAFWNDKMEKYLGIRPQDDVTGCLQDVHWSFAGIGYFPTYTLGNMAAATLFAQYQKATPTWSKEVAEGNLTSAKDYLFEKIHRHGRMGSSIELLKKATGKGFVASDLLDYLSHKYSSL
jgi:carboxypeptidase Taq